MLFLSFLYLEISKVFLKNNKRKIIKPPVELVMQRTYFTSQHLEHLEGRGANNNASERHVHKSKKK